MNPDPINILHEVQSVDEQIIQTVYLENNIKIYVKRRGFAEGSDGKIYFPTLSYQNDEFFCVGWSSDIDWELVL